MELRPVQFLNRTLRFARRLLRDKDFRALAFLRVFKSNALHQTTAFTALDRYPEIFSQCRKLLYGRKGLKILSFGCSTGEEVATLRNYFPDALLVGADINSHSLSRARARHSDANISYIPSNARSIAARGPYDAIFCMAVLQRTPHVIEDQDIEDISQIYPFSKFAEQVKILAANLNAGGLLVVEHAFYRVEDVGLTPPVSPMRSDYLGPSTRVFDRDGRLLRGVTRTSVIYRQQSSAPARDRAAT